MRPECRTDVREILRARYGGLCRRSRLPCRDLAQGAGRSCHQFHEHDTTRAGHFKPVAVWGRGASDDAELSVGPVKRHELSQVGKKWQLLHVPPRLRFKERRIVAAAHAPANWPIVPMIGGVPAATSPPSPARAEPSPSPAGGSAAVGRETVTKPGGSVSALSSPRTSVFTQRSDANSSRV